MTWISLCTPHPPHHHRNSTSTRNNDPRGLKFCRRSYQAKLTTIQHNFNPTIFWGGGVIYSPPWVNPTCFFRQKKLGSKSFWPKFFSSQKLFYPKYFFTQNFITQKFFVPYFFLPKISFTQIFFDWKLFLDLKIFLTQKFFDPKIFFWAKSKK